MGVVSGNLISGIIGTTGTVFGGSVNGRNCNHGLKLESMTGGGAAIVIHQFGTQCPDSSLVTGTQDDHPVYQYFCEFPPGNTIKIFSITFLIATFYKVTWSFISPIGTTCSGSKWFFPRLALGFQLGQVRYKII